MNKIESLLSTIPNEGPLVFSYSKAIAFGEAMYKAGQAASGMQWIKASESKERLPLEKLLHLKDNVGIERLGNFFKEDGELKCAICANGAHEGFEIPEKDLWSIYWLDESGQQSQQEAAGETFIEKFEDDFQARFFKMTEAPVVVILAWCDSWLRNNLFKQTKV
jgi:hypothetical protein